MKTYGNIFATILMALALAACVKEVTYAPVQPRKGNVSFLPATYSPRSKAILTGNVFPTDSVFGAYAVYSADSTAFGTYMDNQPVAYSSGEWLPFQADLSAPVDFYWPRRNRVTFISYAPYSAADPWLDEATYNTATAVNKTPGAQDDWMVSDFAADYNYYLDTMPADNDPSEPLPSSGFTGVPTLFRHALTRVAFNIKASQVVVGADGITVNVDDEREESRVETDYAVVPELCSTRVEDNGVQVLNTIVTVRQKTVTLNMSQTTITTEIRSAQNWTIKVQNIAFLDAVNNGTLELEAVETPGRLFGQAQRLGWTGTWRLADGEDYVDMPLPNALGNNDVTDTYQPLLAERTMLPQPLSHIKLLIDYSSKVNAADIYITTTTDTWTRTRTYTETTVVCTDILNDKELINETDETYVDVDSAKTSSDVVEHSVDTNTTVYLSKEIGLEGQGGLTEWEMNKKITYNITIEPIGKRITWDPAKVENWGAEDSGAIELL